MDPLSLRPNPAIVSLRNASSSMSLSGEEPSFDTVEKLDDKLMAHIVADHYIGGSDFEGNTTEIVSEYLHALLKELQQNPHLQEVELDSVIGWLETVVANSKKTFSGDGELAHYEEEVLDKIRSLLPGESFLMAGGWSGAINSPGHAMLYRFEKDLQGDTYTFHVCNTGFGIHEYHHRLEDEKGYFHYSPTYVRQGISLKEMLNPLFISSLIKIRTTRIMSEEGKRRYHTLYESIFPLVGTLKGASNDPEDYIVGQRSGTCAWRVFNALLRSIILPLENYKKFKIYLNIAAMGKFLEKNRSELAKNKDHRIILEKTAEKIVLLLNKDNHGISLQEKERLHEVCKKVIAEVGEAEVLSRTLPTNLLEFTAQQDAEVDTGTNLELVLGGGNGLLNRLVLDTPNLQISWFPTTPPEMVEITRENLPEQVSVWKQYLEAIKNDTDSHSIIYYGCKFLNSIPLPDPDNATDPLWNNFLENDREKIEEFMQNVLQVCKIIAGQSIGRDTVPPETFLALESAF